MEQFYSMTWYVVLLLKKKKKKKAAIYVLFQLSIKIQVEMLSWPSEHVEMKLKRKSSE